MRSTEENFTLSWIHTINFVKQPTDSNPARVAHGERVSWTGGCEFISSWNELSLRRIFVSHLWSMWEK